MCEPNAEKTDPANEPQAALFDEVLSHELKAVRARRERMRRNASRGREAGEAKKPQDNPPPPASPSAAGPPAAAALPSPPTNPTPVVEARQEALNLGLVGLAFSGGGIRSGTFALGVLQALASLGMLRRFDYLSTVSGGGYIGSWLAAWIHREGDPRNVERQLNPSRAKQCWADRWAEAKAAPLRQVVDEEPEPVYHLRSYSNYLAPQPGFLTPDSWALFAIYVRNLFINLLLLLPATMAVVLLSRLVVWFYAQGVGARDADTPWHAFGWDTAITGLFLLAAGWGVAGTFYAHGAVGGASAAGSGRSDLKHNRAWLLGNIVLPLLAAAVLGSWVFGYDPMRTDPPPALRHWLYHHVNPAALADSPWWFLVLQYGLGFGAFVAVLALLRYLVGRGSGWWTVLFDAVLGVLGGLALLALLNLLVWPLRDRPYALASFAPPLFLLALVLAGYLQLAFVGRWMSEYEREWRSHLAAYLLLCALGWLAFFGVTLYLPWALGRYSAYLNGSLVLGWVATTAGGVLASRSPRTGDKAKEPDWRLEWLARLGPSVFLVGLLALVSWLVSWLLGVAAPRFDDRWPYHLGGLLSSAGAGPLGPLPWLAFLTHEPDFLQATARTPWEPLVAGFGLCVAVVLLVAFVTDVNLFSMHAMYANRLVRCYLAASRRKPEWAGRMKPGPRGAPYWGPGVGGAPTGSDDAPRGENPITGFDQNDDLPLSALRPPLSADDAGGYCGPYPLLNTALELVAGTELAIQDRKAEAFVLTPHYCGSKATGYAETPVGDDAENLTLGRAMAISGAAVDANMAYHQSTFQTALLTVFNARLGWWLQNPRLHDPKKWAASGPKGGSLYLFRELFGRTDERGAFVRLSDGGHFENLGAYELIRRRCRYVVVCDAGEDRQDASENLANLIRLVRTDFGIRVEIDTTPLRKDDKGRSTWHCAVGDIRYDEVDPQAVAGTLVFLRTSLTGDEAPDIRQYAERHPEFPHQQTLDQFFDESQFESYRALGLHVGQAVFADAAAEREVREDPTGVDPGATGRFFARVRHKWFPPPPDHLEHLYQANEDCIGLLESLREDPQLRDFCHDLYRELPPPAPAAPATAAAPAPGQRGAELLAVNQMLAVMEQAWLGVRLDGYHAHPLNRGWMNAFRRWSASGLFQQHWPVLRGEYSKDFVHFCEKALNVNPVPVKVVRLPANVDLTHQPWKDLCGSLNGEFFREWCGELLRLKDSLPVPAGKSPQEYLNALIEQASQLAPGDPPVWLLTQGPIGEAAQLAASWDPDDYPCGVLLVRALPGAGAGTPPYELFVWVRGAYRSLGLGRQCFDKLHLAAQNRDEFLLDHVAATLRGLHPGKQVRLVTRFPSRGVSSGDRLQRALWMRFFHDLNFRRPEPKRDEDSQLLVLERSL